MQSVNAQGTKYKSELRLAPSKLAGAPPRAAAHNPLWARIAMGAQAKLRVGRSDDPAEAEADRVADGVARSPGATTRVTGAASSASDAREVASDFAGTLGPGAPLDAGSRSYFESRLGHDFGAVRVHAGGAAGAAADAMHARAFTLGRDVVFAAGEHDPRSASGRRLLAHELTHVVQQGHPAGAASAPVVQRDDKRAADSKNDVYKGDETGPLAMPGTTFTDDPYDHTVLVVRPDGTGTQYTYEILQTESGPREKLIHTEELSKLRVGALQRLNAAGAGEAQEAATGPATRMKADAAAAAPGQAKWATDHPAEYAAWQAALVKWQAAEKERAADTTKKTKPAPPPPAPKGYPAANKTTLCTAWPGEVYHSAGGNKKQSFDFTPPKTLPSWRTLATNPQGPRPGDIYYLWDTDLNRAAHMGVFKSSTPIPDQPKLQRWVVTDGGQGSYEGVQQVNERSRMLNTETGMFSSDLADAGQNKGDRRLEGWIDIDAQAAANP